MINETLTPKPGTNLIGEHKEFFKVPQLTPTLFPHKSLFVVPDYQSPRVIDNYRQSPCRTFPLKNIFDY